jgi:cell division protein FtsW
MNTLAGVLGGRRDPGRRRGAAVRPVDVAPADPVSFPETGLGRGWEPAALLALTLLLLCFGLVTLYSASSVLAQRQGLPDYHYVVRQAAGGALGLLAMIVVARIPYHWWRALAWPAVVASFVLLILVILPGTEAIAPRINGARRWLTLGVTIQPSEFAKMALLIWTAHMAVRKQDQFRSLTRGLGPFLVVWGLLLVPVLLQPDLSTAALTVLCVGTVVFTAGARITHFIFLGILLLPAALAQLGEGFRASRLMAFRDPGAFADGAGYQVQQSLIAMGSGGLTGVGFGEGRQKFGFLPEPHNDFIFAMVGEEWGLVGVVFLVGLYLGLILVGFRIARRAADLFGELLAVGFTSLIALHALLHMGVGVGLVPSTGLPLPLVSYGRSNLLVTLMAIGVLMAVARGLPEAGVGKARQGEIRKSGRPPSGVGLRGGTRG